MVHRIRKNISEINELVKKAFRIIVTEENNKVNSKKKIEVQMDKEDLRNLVMKGKKELKSAYDILKENGYIKVVDKDFLRVV